MNKFLIDEQRTILIIEKDRRASEGAKENGAWRLTGRRGERTACRHETMHDIGARRPRRPRQRADTCSSWLSTPNLLWKGQDIKLVGRLVGRGSKVSVVEQFGRSLDVRSLAEGNEKRPIVDVIRMRSGYP